MARKRDRVFALVMAVLFLITGFGFTVLAIIESRQSNSPTSNQTTTKLQGTKLKGFTPISDVKQLQVKDTNTGNGTAITSASQTVTVVYTGAVASNGIIFQSSQDTGQPLTTQLNQVIPGWQKGMIGMKVGGTRQILIPAIEAYGSNPPPGSGIPANAALVFNVTLLNISN